MKLNVFTEKNGSDEIVIIRSNGFEVSPWSSQRKDLRINITGDVHFDPAISLFLTSIDEDSIYPNFMYQDFFIKDPVINKDIIIDIEPGSINGSKIKEFAFIGPIFFIVTEIKNKGGMDGTYKIYKGKFDYYYDTWIIPRRNDKLDAIKRNKFILEVINYAANNYNPIETEYLAYKKLEEETTK